jgi:hypothetical protein
MSRQVDGRLGKRQAAPVDVIMHSETVQRIIIEEEKGQG